MAKWNREIAKITENIKKPLSVAAREIDKQTETVLKMKTNLINEHVYKITPKIGGIYAFSSVLRIFTKKKKKIK